MSAAPTPAEVAAARREYDHQRDSIFEYLTACEAVANDKKAGGKLTEGHHYGAEFDTASMREVAEAFLAVSDVRMRVGSGAERVALATLTWQFRRLLPAAPLTATLAEVVRAANSRDGQNGADQRKADAAARAEKVRDIIEQAERKPGRPDLFKAPAAVLKAVRDRLDKQSTDRNTLAGYRALVDAPVKIDGPND